MGHNLKMISFRLNKDRSDDAKIWDYLEKSKANRSQLIKELLIRAINQDSKNQEKKREDDMSLKGQELLLLKISQELRRLKKIDELEERICSIHNRLSFLPELEQEETRLHESEEALLKTIFEQNPIEVS